MSQENKPKKPMFEVLFSIRGLNTVAEVFAFGKDKYDAFGWRNLDREDPGFRLKRVGSALRHLYAHLSGEKLDPESGKPHLAHFVCNALMLLDLESK